MATLEREKVDSWMLSKAKARMVVRAEVGVKAEAQVGVHFDKEVLAGVSAIVGPRQRLALDTYHEAPRDRDRGLGLSQDSVHALLACLRTGWK